MVGKKGKPFVTAAFVVAASIDDRVTSANDAMNQDLRAIEQDAAAIHRLNQQGRHAFIQGNHCNGDPEACSVQLRQYRRINSFPSTGLGFFFKRALFSPETLYVTAYNGSTDAVFGWIGDKAGSFLGLAETNPLQSVSMKGVKGRFTRVYWQSIRYIARRFDHITHGAGATLVAELLKQLFEEQIRGDIEGVQPKPGSGSGGDGGFVVTDLRLGLTGYPGSFGPALAAVPATAPSPLPAATAPPAAAAAAPFIAAAAAAPAAAPKTVSQYAQNQNQIVQDFTGPETRDSSYRPSHDIRGPDLPSSINWDGR